MQCGGSDGLSAITCNPQLGYISDYHGEVGGRTILAETPEILGSREWLLSRCKESDAQSLKNIFENFILHVYSFSIIVKHFFKPIRPYLSPLITS